MITRLVLIILLSWVVHALCVFDDKIDELIDKHNEVRKVTAKIAMDVIKMKGDIQ